MGTAAYGVRSTNLYDIQFRLLQGETVLDEVSSYFGMRKVSIEGGKFCLNNRPYYQRLEQDLLSIMTVGTDDHGSGDHS
nr:hypothetical protein [Paenibacillus yonginensis]